MATSLSPPELMTVERFVELPTKELINRWLDDGRVRRDRATYRNPEHSTAEIQFGFELESWNRTQPAPRGRVVSGEAGFLLRRNPDTLFGIDVAYISTELAAATPLGSNYFEGIPILAVEILSPSDTLRRINCKIEHYTKAMVPLIWVVDPYRRTVLVIRFGVEPVLFNQTQVLSGEPELPGFRVPVARFFED
jgi:Uma2 family endonuclease